MEPVERETVSGAIGGARINFLVSSDDGISSVHFADSSTEIPDQFVQRFIFRLRRQVPVEVAHQADANGDVVKVVAVHVSTIQLPNPTVANLDLTVP